ncbi:MAG: serine hydrolase domain-containing protein [Pseudomonadota bacterium]
MQPASKKRNNAVSLLVAAALTAAIVPSQIHAETPAQHLLSSLQEITGVPGMSAAVSREGETIWSGTAGHMDANEKSSVDAQTKFRIASVSKLFTATLILKLAEEGVLDLDADIKIYVPDWPDHDGAVITLRQLSAHISGIGHYGSGDRYDASRRYKSLSEALTVYAHKPLQSAPGEAYSYSSYGYALMGAAIENATGASFADSLYAVLLQPLGLNNTFVENIDALPENSSELFSATGSPTVRNSQHHVVGATGILSTPGDLVKFANAYSAGDIISPELVAISWAPTLLNDGQPTETERYQVGFGWRIGKDWDGRNVFHHAGTTPGARSILSFNQDEGTAVALLSNAQWVSRIETTGELIATAASEGARLSQADCFQGQWSYEGAFILDAGAPPPDNNALGDIAVTYSDGVCHGALKPDGAMAVWLRERNAQIDHIPVTLIASRGDNTIIFAMATPWGAFPLKWTTTNDDGSVIGDIAGRSIRLTVAASNPDQ